jgi:hypothetical protein
VPRETPSNRIARVVALGASNLTRGFHTVVSSASSTWGREVEVFGALGHGRSYGASSRFVVRSLPGILESDLWADLSERPPAVTRGLVTDIGNDILYGFSAAQTLAWTTEAVDRLQALTHDIVVTGLPLATIRELSRAKFLAFRSALVPQCRLSLVQAVDAAERVHDGLATLANARGLRFCELKPEWYGYDPIHIRPSLWRSAWEEILQADARTVQGPGSWADAVTLYLLRPKRQWICGVEQTSAQNGKTLRAGGKVWLY